MSDGIIAPGYSPGALEILKKKKAGKYTIVEVDSTYEVQYCQQQSFTIIF